MGDGGRVTPLEWQARFVEIGLPELLAVRDGRASPWAASVVTGGVTLRISRPDQVRTAILLMERWESLTDEELGAILAIVQGRP